MCLHCTEYNSACEACSHSAGFIRRLKAFYFETTAETEPAEASEAMIGSRLTIDAARREDGGLYVCTAQNAYGSDTANVQLTVVEPPEPPTNILLDGVGSRTLTLSWNVEFDGNSPLTAVIIELCNETGQPIPYAYFILTDRLSCFLHLYQ